MPKSTSSTPPTYPTLKRLRSSGYFKISAVHNPVLLGIAGGWVGLKVEPSSLISVAYKLTEHPNISFIAYTLGRFDLLIGAHFASMEQLSDFLTLELYNIGNSNCRADDNHSLRKILWFFLAI